MRLLVSITLIGILLSCNSTQSLKDHVYQRRYFPPELNSLYLGMPQAQALKVRPPAALLDSTTTAWTTFHELIGRDDIKEIVYYFDKKESPILYGFVVEYESSQIRQKEMAWRYGKPNHEKTEWKKDSKEGFQLHIWAEDTRLFIFGEISGTTKPKATKH